MTLLFLSPLDDCCGCCCCHKVDSSKKKRSGIIGNKVRKLFFLILDFSSINRYSLHPDNQIEQCFPTTGPPKSINCSVGKKIGPQRTFVVRKKKFRPHCPCIKKKFGNTEIGASIER